MQIHLQQRRLSTPGCSETHTSLGSVSVGTFKKKNECVALQAADLFAYETLASNRFIFEKGIVDFNKLRYPIRQLEPVWSKISNFLSHNFQRLALTTGLLPRCDLSKLVNLRAARKPISDARTATYLILSTGSGPGRRWFKSTRPDQLFWN
jgi:hypothetical protein